MHDGQYYMVWQQIISFFSDIDLPLVSGDGAIQPTTKAGHIQVVRSCLAFRLTHCYMWVYT